ncbi:hypothetical protein A3B05_02405 [Candidatus Giovannonibacteria bacterium RIFCSPLOWO2_01_FULL_43_160]|uniref:Uncharacterized protein n=2 Tax=Candidatus Giovannoniibacteriota TaxID=1752738 RepID=A0A0G1IV57_9BACT|nr:MAG: hypothetical protein UV72_C0002G0031 [Candidatus Giovannonibacteria bacterium GW2011_GWB1_43_13]KKS99199.1 MAG: hypothetical protein UV75_C0008G0033 [Candidatus Giovannonibacteria bacterium GW2011_GWA1_43_15]KKT21209.1 MAG: hypothetical protein UW05_C0015G0012 [Candidatus Giovannonibacteria bacterium GW2011_GWC2_43_8]KKT63000.1 MAG: hypothetical protein UW55_C0007G0040 [Candidatus Giovannonibacteria bacterium GW2011_GWA2_44_26]OGF58461.1 MAG: hypothetical protein A2652_01670 [Candidatus
MIYFLYGENSYQALRKIREFKSAFSKKSADFLIEEFDGEFSAPGPAEFHSVLGQINFFSKIRLVIFRNILESNPKIFEILKESGVFLKNSNDIFVFWEKDLTKHKEVLSFFKKFAEKTQEVKTLGPKELDAWLSKKAQSSEIQLSKEEREVMIEEAGEGAEWALENELEKVALGAPAGKKSLASSKSDFKSPKKSDFFPASDFKEGASPFSFIEKMFTPTPNLLVWGFSPRALLALKEMSLIGIEPQKFIYAFLWKLKQKKMADAYLKGILAESQMRRDPKNSEEHLERFIFSLKA